MSTSKAGAASSRPTVAGPLTDGEPDEDEPPDPDPDPDPLGASTVNGVCPSKAASVAPARK